MSSINNIWGKRDAKPKADRPASTGGGMWGSVKTGSYDKSMAEVPKDKPYDEHLEEKIKEFRDKQATFDTIRHRNTMLTVVFSSNDDAIFFLQHYGSSSYGDDYILDGYELAAKLKIEPTSPSVKLPRPMTPLKKLNK